MSNAVHQIDSNKPVLESSKRATNTVSIAFSVASNVIVSTSVISTDGVIQRPVDRIGHFGVATTRPLVINNRAIVTGFGPWPPHHSVDRLVSGLLQRPPRNLQHLPAVSRSPAKLASLIRSLRSATYRRITLRLRIYTPVDSIRPNFSVCEMSVTSRHGRPRQRAAC